ncbi:prepilin-type N-terminal cleavage/methylation domain-containing protein [Thalassotalea sp. 1_MG-2023]|uniref:PilW family protein n=1 Tax=Thalassotalea sp. 1_MG-2023 TaxID=3062680 RepID=UPI0026E2099F|nr:prepilin-type N-terminal cleavage/methylation domain-containing protein [Thalassotalea sp. 1_MG-2023]MDO6426498.1 prepilin-type N-terminal cleavage/methylation domain-containing protein [Thalassotalea sp. 1_MG-2023]
MKKQAGFTLIEMLVSMTLLSMVMLIATSAYSLFSERWNGRLGHFNQTLATTKNLLLVQESLQSIIGYVVSDDNQSAKYYFEGNRNGFVAVTLRSMFNPSVAAVVRLKFEQNDDFTFRLIYQESPMEDQMLVQATQDLDFVHSVTLFESVKNAEFRYYGWPSLASKNWTPDFTSMQPPTKEWSSNYNSLEKNVFPNQVRVAFTISDKQYSLQSRLNKPIPAVLSNYANQQQ